MFQWMRILALVAGLTPFGALAQGQDATEAPDDPLQYDAPVQNADPNKPLIPSFQRKATQAGGPANELNTGDWRARERLPGGSIGAAVSGTDLYHGNFCGYGNKGADLQPTDVLDAACKRHDECYDQTNRACSCDAALKSDAYKVAELKTASRELRMRAMSVLEAIPAMNCRPN